MDAKEATEIVKNCEGEHPSFALPLRCEARGYLAALNGPEVKELINALEWVHPKETPAEQARLKALSKFKEASKV